MKNPLPFSLCMAGLRMPALAACILLSLLSGRRSAGELTDQEWKKIQAELNAAFQGNDAEAKIAAVSKLAKADDARALPLLAGTVKLANAQLAVAVKQEADLRKAIDKIPFVQEGDKRRYEKAEDMERLKELQEGLKTVQEGITALLKVKRIALGGFTSKTDGKALDWLFAKGLQNPDWEVRVGVVEAMAEIKDEARAGACIVTALSDKDPHVRVAALSAAMAKDLKTERQKYLAMLKDREWEVVAQALEVIAGFGYRDAETVDALIEGLCAAEGRAAEDYEKVLEKITGLSYYGDGKLWQKWWKDNRSKFAPAEGAPAPAGKEGFKGDPAPEPAPVPRPEPGKPHITGSFYGIETKSHNIIYVLDVSGSMAGPATRRAREGEKPGPVITGEGEKKKGDEPKDEGPTGNTKLDFVKYELKKSIRLLSQKAWFNVIFYSDHFEIWQEEMVRANPQNKQKAYEFIDKQGPNGTTNIFDAMEKAFKMAGPGKPKEQADERYAQTMGGADTIFLLSDGSPNAGRVPEAGAILEEIAKLNKLRKITIHTVGVGDHNVPFMQKLAEQNDGKYVKAD